MIRLYNFNRRHSPFVVANSAASGFAWACQRHIKNERPATGYLLVFRFLLLAFALVSSAGVRASTQTIDLSVERSESAKISNIDDWLIGVFTSIDSINTIQYNWDWQCVYTSTGSYSVQVVSQNGGTSLFLESDSGDRMDYWIYSYVRRGNSYQLNGHTDSVIDLNNLSGSQSLTCADENIVGTNLWFAALVRPADFNPAPPGVYRDSVTLIVSPE